MAGNSHPILGPATRFSTRWIVGRLEFTWRTRNAETPKFSPRHNSTKMPPKGDINAALEALKLADSIDYTATAKKFGVNRSTLSKRHRGVQGSCEAKAEKSRNLNNTQEDKLIVYIGKLYSKGLPPTHAIVRNFRRGNYSETHRIKLGFSISQASRRPASHPLDRRRRRQALQG